MIAFEVKDDPDYQVVATVVENNFAFDCQYDIWRTREEARVELKKRLRADIEYLHSILAELG